MTARVGGAVVLLLSAAAGQEPLAEVLVLSIPAAWVESVAPKLQQWFGERIAIEALPATSLEPPAGPRLFLLCDEWMLARLAAKGALDRVPPLVAERAGLPGAAIAFVLPFAGEYALAVATDLMAVPRTWE